MTPRNSALSRKTVDSAPASTPVTPDAAVTPSSSEDANVQSLAVHKMKRAFANCEKEFQSIREEVKELKNNLNKIENILIRNIAPMMEQAETYFDNGKKWADEDLQAQKDFQKGAFHDSSSSDVDAVVSDYKMTRAVIKDKYKKAFV